MNTEKKLTKKSKVIGTIGISAMLLVLMVGFGVFYLKDRNKDSDVDSVKDTEVVNGQDESSELPMTFSRLQIEADQVSEYGVELASTFTVTIKDGLSVEQVRSGLSTEPELEIDFIGEEEADQAGTRQLQFQFREKLPENRIIRIKYEDGEENYGFAFQTQEPLRLKNIYPSDGSEYVPIDSGIELVFNKQIDESILDFLVIEPHIEVEYLWQEKRVVLVPKEDLESGETYRVGVREGYEVDYGSGIERLEERYSIFVTDYDYDEYFHILDRNRVIYADPNQYALEISPYTDNGIGEVDLRIYTVTDVPQLAQDLGTIFDLSRYMLEEKEEDLLYELESSMIESNGRKYFQLPQTIPAGVYYLEAQKGGYQQEAILQVGFYDAYLTIDNKNLFCFVQNSNGQNLALDLYSGNAFIGTLSSEGTGLFAYEAIEGENNYFTALDSQGTTIFLGGYVNTSSEQMGDEFYSYLYTDRNLYLPTDKIEVFGYLQHRKGIGQQEIKVVLSYEDQVLEEKIVEPTITGGFSTFFEIEDFYQYSLQLAIYADGEKIRERLLNVMEFEKPNYRLETEIDREIIMDGESLNLFGTLGYFSGAPMKDASVSISNNSSFMLVDGAADLTITADQNGKFMEELTPTCTTDQFEPMNLTIQSLATNIDDEYIYEYENLVYFPRDRMAEITTTKLSDTSFQAEIVIHNIDTTRIIDNPFDKEQYRSDVVSGAQAQVYVIETYYEEVKTGEYYDEVEKRTIETYEYIEHVNTVYDEELTSNEEGKIFFEYSQVIKERSYEVSVSMTDRRDKSFRVSSYYHYFGIPYQDMYQDYYYMNTVNNVMSINETALFSVYKNGTLQKESEEDRLLILKYRDGLTEYLIQEEVEYRAIFLEEDIPNVAYRFVYYDGEEFQLEEQLSMLAFNSKDKELKLELNCDQEVYQPNDLVHYSGTLRDQEGNPVSADINLSVVDEAFFRISEDDMHPLDVMYEQKYDFHILASFCTKADQYFWGAEMGGEGGGGTLRNEFKNTASFITLRSNAEGNFSGSFVVPDNLTDWRITATAIGPNQTAAKVTRNIQVQLPLFADLRVENSYLQGDDIYAFLSIGSLSATYGSPTQVSCAVFGEADDVAITSMEMEAKSGDILYLPIGSLTKGQYRIQVTIDDGQYQDAIEKTFIVMEHLGFVDHVQTDMVSEKITLKHNDQFIEVSFMNQNVHDYYQTMLDMLKYYDNQRTELGLTALFAEEYINSYFYQEEAKAYLDMDRYCDNVLLKPLSNAAGDLILTARYIQLGLMTYYKDWQIEDLKIRARALIVEEPVDQMEYYTSLYILAALDEPVLLEIQEQFKNFDDLSQVNHKLMLLAALARCGELTTARAYFDQFLSQDPLMDGDQIRKIDEDAAVQEEMMALFMQVNILVKDFDRAAKLFEIFSDYEALYSPLEVEKLLYLITSKAPSVEETTIEYRVIDEKSKQFVDQQFQLTGLETKRIVLSPDQARSLTFTKVVGEVTFSNRYLAYINEIEQDGDSTITKSYSEEDILVGDTVKVNITVQANGQGGSFVIQDLIPAGLEFIELVNPYGNPQLSVYGTMIGDRLRCNAYYSSTSEPRNITFTISYLARAIVQGKYQDEGIVINSQQDDTYNVGDKTWINIR